MLTGVSCVAAATCTGCTVAVNSVKCCTVWCVRAVHKIDCCRHLECVRVVMWKNCLDDL